MKNLAFLILAFAVLLSCKSDTKKLALNTPIPAQNPSNNNIQDNLKIIPISHATMVLDWNGTIIYVDPVGGAKAFSGQASPDLILITDIHGDHLSTETLDAIVDPKTTIVSPEAVDDELRGKFDGQRQVLYNGDISEFEGIKIEAIPMYNLREEALKFHQKGRGNGYVIEKDGTRIYISGDTEDIPEMRALEDIDIAFVCMNLPYTMTVKSAASAVVDFMPKKVYPYHYRGTEGLSDVGLFKTWIKKSGKSREIEVVQLDWYPVQ